MSQSRLLELSADAHKQLLAGFNIYHPSRFATEDDIGIAVNVLSLDNNIIFCSLQPEHHYAFEFIVSCKFALILPTSSESTKTMLNWLRNLFSISSRLKLMGCGTPFVTGSSLNFCTSFLASRILPASNRSTLMARRDIEVAPALLEDPFKL
jgi:hypothetical protein